MSTNTTTKEKLISIINDIELISDHFLESTIMDKVSIGPTAKAQQSSSGTTDHLSEELLTQAICAKEKELKETLKTAEKQIKLQAEIDESNEKLAKKDQEIKQLQMYLKEAEHILSRAVYQAKQKLDKIAKANENRVSAEELIKFAHRISASNAVSAPLSWGPGDPRRPYPQDLEMREGVLYQIHEYSAGVCSPVAGGAGATAAGVMSPAGGHETGATGLSRQASLPTAGGVGAAGESPGGGNTGGWKPPPEQGPTRSSPVSYPNHLPAATAATAGPVVPSTAPGTAGPASATSVTPVGVMDTSGGSVTSGGHGGSHGGDKEKQENEQDEVMSTDSSSSSSSDSQ